MLSTLLNEVGAKRNASWLLAEGADAAVMTRSIPKEIWNEAMIVYAQNGEAVRPENGYPIRFLNPGCEGNSSVKWLRRIEISDRPFMTREETSKYTEPVKGGVSRQFSLIMDARSIITYPSYPNTVEKAGSSCRESPGVVAVKLQALRSAQITGAPGMRRHYRDRSYQRRTCDSSYVQVGW